MWVDVGLCVSVTVGVCSSPSVSLCRRCCAAYVPATTAYLYIPLHSHLPITQQAYDFLGNAWEWVAGGDPTKRTLRGGSFVDFDPLAAETSGSRSSSKGGSGGGQGQQQHHQNHKITPGTRMETTQDSGSANTSFRCASSPAKKGGSKRRKRKDKDAAAAAAAAAATSQEL